jgi:hypothetical protein
LTPLTACVLILGVTCIDCNPELRYFAAKQY